MTFYYSDGGRTAAGYRGFAGDCVCRAIAIVTEKPYQEIDDALNERAKRENTTRGRSSARTGMRKATYKNYLRELGFTWTPTMGIGTGCKVHLREDELPKGRLLVEVSRHVTAVIDGVINDTHDPTRGGRRCVYGYWMLNRTSA